MSKEVTVCLTSCGRYDLLEKTLKSFFKFNSYPIKSLYIYEDRDLSAEEIIELSDLIQGAVPLNQYCEILHGKSGQIKAIDQLYEMVDTEYIFHIEDDWEFYAHNFIEQSIDILEKHPKIINVWIRSERDTNGHRVEGQKFKAGNAIFKLISPVYKGIWHGFTFNPGLRRKSDYDLLGSYSAITTFNHKEQWHSEAAIGKWYHNKGFRAAIIAGNGFVKHLGENRGVRV